MIFLLILTLGSSVGISAYNLVNLKKTDGNNVLYRGTNIEVQIPDTYDLQASEFRAVWVTTLTGDIAAYSSETQYKAEMNKVFEVMEYYNLNAMIFHIRTHNNALYNSDLNPVASWYSSVDFNLWDPLEWIIEESHKRGIEFHAWLNPYRVSTSYSGTVEDYALTVPSYNIASNPENLLKTTNGILLNPGEPAVRNFLVDSVMEIINRYDVDAIHFDDYFYTDGIDDTTTRNKYNTSNLSIEDFRRQQIDIFIEQLYNEMRSFSLTNNRVIQLGISPTGIIEMAVIPQPQNMMLMDH